MMASSSRVAISGRQLAVDEIALLRGGLTDDEVFSSVSMV